MKTRLAFLVMIVVLAIALAYGCLSSDRNGPAGENGVGQTPEPPNGDERVSQQLVDIFPRQIGHEWFYSGFAEYGHRMKLDNISGSTDSPEVLVYEISGEVDDPSDGEATGDFGLELEYVITKDTVTERINRGEKLIHVFQELQLLRLPLEPGTKWKQKVDTDGEEAVLTAEILSAEIEEEEGPVVYRVRYSVPMEGMPEGTFIEERAFAEGAGLVYYARTLGEEYDFMFEYFIFQPEND
ncbi:MAG: hypothetical protein WCS98_05195 [Bacillota bacterium]|nr:hypothetical protein [Bacillota bacterium]MDD3298527.1 hypothetical protein [Bacillota bacterium]MDD3850990.1 hypothetical protein [Bacillota bacterium]MDD4708121.1 hypothetical protein [Bacillota bacterium]